MATSMLSNLLSDIRLAIDDPDVTAKYTDNEIIRIAGLAMRRAYQDLSRLSGRPYVVSTDLSIVAGTQVYALPPSIGRVIQMGKFDTTTGNWEWRIDPTTRRHPFLTSVQLSGSRLTFQSPPTDAETLRVEYIPSGDFLPYEAKSTTSSTAETTTFKGVDRANESTKLVRGIPDDRPNSYVGAIIRCWEEADPSNGLPIIRENRVTGLTLANSAGANRTFAVDLAWSPVLANSTEYRYEVLPFEFEGVRQLVVLGAAMTLAGFGGLLAKQKSLLLEYQSAVRIERLFEGQVSPYAERMPTTSYSRWRR